MFFIWIRGGATSGVGQWVQQARCSAERRRYGTQVKEVIAEILGRHAGAAHGIGGSMHLYKREHGFYGGEGIVGTHVRALSKIKMLHFATRWCPGTSPAA